MARLCRRICLLREREQPAAAEELRSGALEAMLAVLRTQGESEADIAQRIATIFATETERVANAAVLAELLAPLLGANAPSAATAAATSRGDGAAASPTPLGPTLASAPLRADPANIADFIDEMIAQERAHPPAAPPRRAC